MKRKATAVWKGGLKNGQGHLTTESKTLADTPYSFKDRFEDGPATNPEELIGAAHAGCFTMALSGELAKEHVEAESIETTATVSLEKTAEGFAIPAIHLEVKARIPKVDKTIFEKAVQNAKDGCPVSKLFKATITVDAHLN